MAKSLTPCLWFDTEAEDAANFYVSMFPNSKIVSTSYYGEAGPVPRTGLTVEFELDGQQFIALNGGPRLHVQRGDLAPGQLRGPGRGRPLLGDALRRRRGRPVRLAQGPVRALVAGRAARLARLLQDPDPDKANRVMAAMLKMGKLDIAELDRAAEVAHVA